MSRQLTDAEVELLLDALADGINQTKNQIRRFGPEHELYSAGIRIVQSLKQRVDDYEKVEALLGRSTHVNVGWEE